MPVSLRSLAVALCVVSAAFISALTLSVTVTKAIASLHAMGDRHAMALADVLRWELEHFFELPSVSLDIMKNASRVNKGGWPGSSSLQTRRYLDQAMLHLFLQRDVQTVNFLFYDGIYVVASFFDSNATSSSGIILAVGRYIDSVGYTTDKWFFDSGLRTYSDPVYNSPARSDSPKNDLDRAKAASLNGSVSGWLPEPIVVVVDNVARSYAGIVAPLRNPSRELIGFSGPSVLMDRVQRFLQDARVTSSSYAFVLDKTRGIIFSTSCPVPFESWSLVPSKTTTVAKGCILAKPSAAFALFSVNTSTSNGSTYLYCRALAKDYAYAPFQALAADRAFSYAEAQVTRYTTVDGAGYFAASTPVFVRYPNVFLQLMVTMPETEVVGDIETPISMAVGVSVAVALVAAVVIVALMAVLLQPIVRIADELDGEDPIRTRQPRMQSETNAVGSGSIGAQSVLSEVRQLQTAHRAMRHELERIQSFVPCNASDSAKLDHEVTAHLQPNSHLTPIDPCASDVVAGIVSVDDIVLDAVCVGPDHLSPEAHNTPPAPLVTPPSPSVARGLSLAPSGRLRRVRFRMNSLNNVVPTLMRREVAVMCANVNGFHRLVQQMCYRESIGPAAAIAEVVRVLIRDVHRAVYRRGGAIERFHGDSVVASFNANVFDSGRAGGAQVRESLLLASLDLLQGVTPSNATTVAVEVDSPLWHPLEASPPDAVVLTDPTQDLLPAEVSAAVSSTSADDFGSEIRWRIGVAQSTAIVGLAGTDSTKATHIIGSAWTHAAALEQLGKVHRVRGVLVSDRFLAALGKTSALRGVEWRVLGSHRLPGHTTGRSTTVLGLRRRLTSDDGGDTVLHEQRRHHSAAAKLSNTERVLRSEGHAGKAAQATRSLVDLVGGEAEREAWELREALRWSDIPALQSVALQSTAAGAACEPGTQRVSIRRELSTLLFPSMGPRQADFSM